MVSRKLTKRQLRKLLRLPTVTTEEIKPDKASVYVTDYEGGGSQVVKTETSGTTGQTRIISIRKSSPTSQPIQTIRILPNGTPVNVTRMISYPNQRILRRLKEVSIQRAKRFFKTPQQRIKEKVNNLQLIKKLK